MTTNKEWEEEIYPLLDDLKAQCILDKDDCNVDYIENKIINFIQELFDKQKEEIAFDFLYKLQEKANTIPPNLLLNEAVNIAWEYKLLNK